MDPTAIKSDVLERFLRYVRIDTQSQEGVERYPSTAKQLDLLRLLAEELRELGVDHVELDEYGYVMARLDSTLPDDHPLAGTVPTIGFLAHVDTSPEVSGAGVRPQVIESYDGGVIELPGDPSQTLDPDALPHLAASVGATLVTTDGTTLLGADDKAGVAEIMSAVAYLVAHPEIPRGPIAIAFTPDEEVGRGTEFFSIERFGARYAYTLDGSVAGRIEHETFSADLAVVTVRGVNSHPGRAKGRMVNALRIAADIVAALPRDHLSPESTEGYEGFLHPYRVDGGVEEVRIRILLRAFDEAGLEAQRMLLREIVDELGDWDPEASIEVAISPQYRNMRERLEEVPEVVEKAREAIRRVGLEPRSTPVRGGTDGSWLTARGLPTPNLFTGGHNYHSKIEWANVDTMVLAVRTIVELARIWAED